MAGRYDCDPLFLALKRIGRSSNEAEAILTEIDGGKIIELEFGPIFAGQLVAQFSGNRSPYHVALKSRAARGVVRVEIFSRCAKPIAPWAGCFICDTPVKTCKKTIPAGNDYCCPVHPGGAEFSGDMWVCSPECWEIAKKMPR